MTTQDDSKFASKYLDYATESNEEFLAQNAAALANLQASPTKTHTNAESIKLALSAINIYCTNLSNNNLINKYKDEYALKKTILTMLNNISDELLATNINIAKLITINAKLQLLIKIDQLCYQVNNDCMWDYSAEKIHAMAKALKVTVDEKLTRAKNIRNNKHEGKKRSIQRLHTAHNAFSDFCTKGSAIIRTYVSIKRNKAKTASSAKKTQVPTKGTK